MTFMEFIIWFINLVLMHIYSVGLLFYRADFTLLFAYINYIILENIYSIAYVYIITCIFLWSIDEIDPPFYAKTLIPYIPDHFLIFYYYLKNIWFSSTFYGFFYNFGCVVMFWWGPFFRRIFYWLKVYIYFWMFITFFWDSLGFDMGLTPILFSITYELISTPYPFYSQPVTCEITSYFSTLVNAKVDYTSVYFYTKFFGLQPKHFNRADIFTLMRFGIPFDPEVYKIVWFGDMNIFILFYASFDPKLIVYSVLRTDGTRIFALFARDNLAYAYLFSSYENWWHNTQPFHIPMYQPLDEGVYKGYLSNTHGLLAIPMIFFMSIIRIVFSYFFYVKLLVLPVLSLDFYRFDHVYFYHNLRFFDNVSYLFYGFHLPSKDPEYYGLIQNTLGGFNLVNLELLKLDKVILQDLIQRQYYIDSLTILMEKDEACIEYSRYLRELLKNYTYDVNTHNIILKTNGDNIVLIKPKLTFFHNYFKWLPIWR